MSEWQIIITVLVMAASVWITRFVPFLAFSKTKNLPRFVDYLGKTLPAAMMGFLVIYCFKDISFTHMQSFLPALIAAAVVVGVHLLKRNIALSIVFGTASYMLLIRWIH